MGKTAAVRWAIVAAFLGACAEEHPAVVHAAARGSSGDQGQARWLVPLTSRTEVVPVGDLTSAGLELELPSLQTARVRATIVPHALDEQVLETPEGFVIVGPPTLAHSTEGVRAPRLARQDGTTSTGSFTLEAPRAMERAALVLVGGGTSGPVTIAGHERRMPAGPRGALLLLRPGARTEVRADAQVDQAFYVDRLRPWRTPRYGEWFEGSVEGGRLVLPLPELDEDQTAAVLVELLEEVATSSRQAMEAAAPRTALTDVAGASGLDMVHLEGPDLQLDIRPTMGPGAAIGDFDEDGWLDVFLVQGAGRPEMEDLPHQLFLGTAEGTFRDATSGAGLGGGEAGMGALAVDCDGDGHLDLYLANQGRDRLLLGRGDGTFEDHSDLLPDLELWSSAAAAADFDGDGDLDLYVTSYLEFDPGAMPPPEEVSTMQREDPLEMLPYLFRGQRNQFLRNDLDQGRLAFTEVAEELGVHDPKTRSIGAEEEDAPGLGMQVMWWDFDRDGDQDLYVANDVTPNVLYENLGDGTFADRTLEAGLDDPRGGMGLAIADVDGDGDEDLFLTNWELEANALYLNLAERRVSGRSRRPRFRDGAIAAGLGAPGLGVTGWAPVWFDLENDGDLDLFVANGYTSPDYRTTGICVGQPDHLFVAMGPTRFELRQAAAPTEHGPCASRGAIAFDYDRDGDEDLLVTANNGAVRLLQNNAPRSDAGSWIGIRLEGRSPNTRGVGAEVTVSVDDRFWRRSLRAGEGYLTSGPGELHFGLGQRSGKARVEVRWPSGATSIHEELPLGELHLLSQP